MELYYVWWSSLTSKRVTWVYQHQQSFLLTLWTVLHRCHVHFNINININVYIAQTPTVRPRGHYIVIISCVIQSSMYCTVENKRFLSWAKSNCRFCSFQFSRQLVPRSRCSSGKCSIRHFPVRPSHDMVSTCSNVGGFRCECFID